MPMPEHVEKHPSGATMCRHCGGEVAEDGYAMGGEIENMPSEEQLEHGALEREPDNDEALFADSLRRRRGGR